MGMNEVVIVQLSAFPGWLVGVCSTPMGEYICWVITPELMVLSDGEMYTSDEAAMESGRCFVQQSLGR